MNADAPLRVDTHAHVFERGLPLTEGRRYAPAYDATLGAYLGLLDTNDIGYGVLVQPSFLGTDNSFLLRALSCDRHRLRGVAVVDPDVSEDNLARMHAQGITGVRLNLVERTLPDLRAKQWTLLLDRLSRLGWHVELHCEAARLSPLIESLLAVGLPVVVDHYGRPDPAMGTRDPGFRELLGFGTSDRVWVKLSGVYRCADAHSNFAQDATDRLLGVFGAKRLMWGSDWPHTQFEDVTRYGSTLSALTDLRLETDVMESILGSTARSFYSFGEEMANNYVLNKF